MEHTFYHSLLRISSLTLAFVLIFESGVLSSHTKELAQGTHEYLANAISMQATVAPTDLNQMTAELTAQKNQLAEREAALAERELAIGLSAETNDSSETTTLILSIILFILLVLILLNYTLDYLRLTRNKPEPAVS